MAPDERAALVAPCASGADAFEGGWTGREIAYHLADGERVIGPSLAAMRAARASTLTILERFTEAEWARTGMLTEQGPYSVSAWLRDDANHPHDHAGQALRVLAATRNGAVS